MKTPLKIAIIALTATLGTIKANPDVSTPENKKSGSLFMEFLKSNSKQEHASKSMQANKAQQEAEQAQQVADKARQDAKQAQQVAEQAQQIAQQAQQQAKTALEVQQRHSAYKDQQYLSLYMTTAGAAAFGSGTFLETAPLKNEFAIKIFSRCGKAVKKAGFGLGAIGLLIGAAAFQEYVYSKPNSQQ